MNNQEREHKKVLRLLNGCINTYELIRLYFPNYTDPRSARHAFCRTITETPDMAQELNDIGFKDTNLMQSPRINTIFVRHWGVPDEVMLFLSQIQKEL